MINKMSLKLKLIGAFLLVGLLPVMVISILAYNNSSSNVSQEVLKGNQTFAMMIESQLNSYFNERKNNAKVISDSSDIYQSVNSLRQVGWNTADPQWLEQGRRLDSFARVVTKEFGYAFLFITDPSGKVIYSTRQEVLGADLRTRDYIQNALKGNTNWSDLFYSDVIKQNCMVVATPILASGSAGEIIGTLSLISAQTEIEAQVHKNIAQLGQSADAYLVNEKGLLLTNTLHGEFSTGAALNQTINTRATQLLAGAIRDNNESFIVQEEYQDYLGNIVLGSLRTIMMGDTLVGLIVEKDSDEAFAGVLTMRNSMILIAALSSVVIGAIGLAFAIQIVRPVQLISGLATKLAEGDFTQKAEVKSNDEIGQMAKSLNDTIDALSNALSKVKGTSEMVAYAAEEISSGNQDLSQRTEEQASALEELSSTIEEMTSSLEASAGNAVQANSLSKQTLDNVIQGEEVVKEMQYAMNDITKGSQEIAEIIGKVNDIAFQTNLLALNAAVEAARAGEQGRGFAVVAAEVRNLAGRSAESAKEIEKLIKDSISRVDRGNSLMIETEEVLKGIVSNTQKTSDVVAEISASLREQSSAAADIRSAIGELNDVTQQNASLVEEIASSSENMSSEAIELSGLVQMFKLKE